MVFLWPLVWEDLLVFEDLLLALAEPGEEPALALPLWACALDRFFGPPAVCAFAARLPLDSADPEALEPDRRFFRLACCLEWCPPSALPCMCMQLRV